jgi:hypothetical protein
MFVSFGSTSINEQTSPVIKLNKSYLRASVTDGHLEAAFRPARRLNVRLHNSIKYQYERAAVRTSALSFFWIIKIATTEPITTLHSTEIRRYYTCHAIFFISKAPY